jgi:hypothetical protein
VTRTREPSTIAIPNHTKDSPFPERSEHLCAFRARSCSLDFVQKSVVFFQDCAVKSTVTPAQRITGIVTYRGMKMWFPALLDEFNYIFDGHRNLLIDDVDTVEVFAFPLIGRNRGRIRRVPAEG